MSHPPLPPPLPPSTGQFLNDEQKKELTQKHMPYVKALAGKIRKRIAKDIDFDDLIEYGMIGLLEATERYDPSQGVSFITFAHYRIRGAIYDGLRGMGWFNRNEYARFRFQEKANTYLQELAQEHTEQQEVTASVPPGAPHGPSSPAASVSAKKATYEHSVRTLANAVTGLASIYMISLDSEEIQNIKDQQTPLVEESLGRAEITNLMQENIKKLPAQERQLLELYYYQDMNLKEVGERLGLSKSWVCRLHAKAISKLQKFFEEEMNA